MHMASFSSYLAMNNSASNDALGRLSIGAGDKLKKLQLTSSSKLSSITGANGANSNYSSDNVNGNCSQLSAGLNSSSISSGSKCLSGVEMSCMQYEEILVTIRKSERGFGFELKNGILIVKVVPNSPAFNSGIRVGDIILKVNGTCVRTKETNEITQMIHESNSFVSLSLQRKLTPVLSSADQTKSSEVSTAVEESNTNTEESNKLKNLANQVANLIPDAIKDSTKNTSADPADENSENTSNSVNNIQSTESSSFRTDDLDKTLETSDTTNHNHSESDTSKSILRSDSPVQQKPPQPVTTPSVNPTSLNRTKSMNSANNRAESVDKSDFNSSDSVGSACSKTHRKQHSMSNDSFQQKEQTQQERKLSDLSAAGRRAHKKNRSTNNSKTYQTQSLSNIASPALIHSNSDNEINPMKLHKSRAETDNNEFIIAYKDDFSFTSEDNLHDSSSDKNSLDLTGFIDYKQLMSRPVNVAILLNYLLAGSESPKNLYFCMFVEELVHSSEKKETLARWSYEIYSTFLMNNAPLKVKSSEIVVKKIEDIFDRNSTEHVTSLKKLFEEAKFMSIEVINLQLNKFREVNQMGLANLFQGGSEFLRLYQQNKTDSDQIRSSILNLFATYIGEITTEVSRLSGDWNDARSHEAHSIALISSFCTYVKRYNLPLKHLGKVDIDKVPTFVNKKFKIKKTHNNTAKGHNFIEFLFPNCKPLCHKCRQPFWGIGNQGLICQKSKCEIKLHRSCFNPGTVLECHGSKNKIGADYKEKLDSFQKILFGSGSKKKEEDAEERSKHMFSGMGHSTSATLPTSSNIIANNNSHLFPNVTTRDSIDDRQPSLILPNGEGFDQRNLPVDIAIKKFEMLNRKPSSTSPGASPGNAISGSINLSRANTINNGNVSPTSGQSPSSSTLHRFNSLANTTSVSLGSPISESYKNSNQTQILPNRQYHQALSNAKENNNNVKNPENNLSASDSSNRHSAKSRDSSNSVKSNSKEANGTSSNSSSANACKRVGSLKVDANKKVKSNIARSKSDPEPDEIKNAQNAISNANLTNVNDRLSIDSTSTNMDYSNNQTNSTNNDSLNSTYTSSQRSTRSSSSHVSPRQPANINHSHSMLQTHHNHQPLSTSTSTSTLTTLGTLATTTGSSNSTTATLKSTGAESRHSWMNDSDMEVEEELPNLSMHADRSLFEGLSKKDMKVQEVINELIHTEQKHVRNLKIMQNHFYIPIKIEMVLSEEERNLLFPNLEEVLELHATFNNRLKRLRKESSVVDVAALTEIIAGQFQGEQGLRYQNACAVFCQNQSEAMKLLQIKMRQTTDKFTVFLNRSENDAICRKLHLKDFLPTEVQRLVKYRLLFHELIKNTSTDKPEYANLVECMEASSRISTHVNKAVTECENRKRVIEIQSRLDTKEFDQYCTKSSVLLPYKNLNLLNRRLVYEGELDWRISNMNTFKLTALLFEDIFVFLEKVRGNTSSSNNESASDEKPRRYLLRPLIYSISKTKQIFTPVIPLSCLNSFGSMPDKRSFHLVAFIEEPFNKSFGKHSLSSSKPIQTQILFILTTKSGDERNKWTAHLQEVTGKMLQNANVDHLTSPPPAPPVASTITPSLTSTTSLAHLGEASSTFNPSMRHSNSMSTSTLVTRASDLLGNITSKKSANQSQVAVNEAVTAPVLASHGGSLFSDLDAKTQTGSETASQGVKTSAQLRSEIALSTNTILAELSNRHQLLLDLFKLESPELDTNEDRSLLFTNSSNLLDNSIGLLNTLSTNLNSIDTKKLVAPEAAVHIQNTKLLMKLEDCLNKLRDETNSSDVSKLPSLILPTSELESLQIPTVQTHPAIGSDVTRCLHRNRSSFNAYRNSEPNTATTQDLSEDEQINYYDDEDIEDEDELENHVQDCTIDSKTNDSVSKNSNSLNLKPNSSDADDESEGRQLTEEHQNNSDEDEDDQAEDEDEEEDSDEPDLDDEDAEEIDQFNYTDGLGKAVTSIIESGIKTRNNRELTVDEKKSYTEFIKNQISPKKSINLSEEINNLTTSQIKTQIIESTNALKQLMSTKHGNELPTTSTTEGTINKSPNVSSSSSPSSSSSEPMSVPPKLPTSPPPLLATSNNECHDSSDDEVKDYLALKDHNNYDEISHV